MFPNREMAEKELEIAGQLNKGPWTEHSILLEKSTLIFYK